MKTLTCYEIAAKEARMSRIDQLWSEFDARWGIEKPGSRRRWCSHQDEDLYIETLIEYAICGEIILSEIADGEIEA
jgi:hypothetical protein